MSSEDSTLLPTNLSAYLCPYPVSGFLYRKPGWIGTEEVNRDAGLEPGETYSLCVSPGSSPVSRFTSSIRINPGRQYIILCDYNVSFFVCQMLLYIELSLLNDTFWLGNLVNLAKRIPSHATQTKADAHLPRGSPIYHKSTAATTAHQQAQQHRRQHRSTVNASKITFRLRKFKGR